MCFGSSAPSAPTIQYVGPSEDDIRRNEESLSAFQAQMQQQQAATAASIQGQIADANARTREIQSQFDEEYAISQRDTSAAEAAATEARNKANEAKKAAAAAAGASYTPIGAYGVTATQSSAPTAQTTEEIAPKKKPKTTLKISPTATAEAGSGLNIGV